MTWFALLMTINGEIVGAIPYPDAMSCGRALPGIHSALIGQHDDVMLQCLDSGIPKTRPRARPDNLKTN